MPGEGDPVGRGGAFVEIRRRVAADRRKIVVIDDDPTGCQTVQAVNLFTRWDAATLAELLAEPEPLAYVLTNSRSLPPLEAAALARELGGNLRAAAQQTGRPFTVISRSDSTLRGHFPVEVEALQAGLGETFDAMLLAPCFFEGGRVTKEDIHWVQQGGQLIPAHLTPFALDPAFGYHSAYLPAWVEEKTGGRIQAGEVASLSLEMLRNQPAGQVAEALRGASGGEVIILNAEHYGDLEAAVLAQLLAEEAGKRFLARSAASYVRVRGGIEPQPPLTSSAMRNPAGARNGGLVIVGSFVPQTTRQLKALLAGGSLEPLEVDVTALLAGKIDVAALAAQVDARLAAGRDVAVFTSRQRLALSGEAALAVGQRISAALAGLAAGLTVAPRYFIVKGGITASEVAVQGLGARKARVLGQALPGVPVWGLGVETHFPNLPYIVFPGNVGGDEALGELVEGLRMKPACPPAAG